MTGDVVVILHGNHCLGIGGAASTLLHGAHCHIPRTCILQGLVFVASKYPHDLATQIDGKPAFKSLEVWHSENADVKDPVLVGIRNPFGKSWETERDILARWGEVLAPLAELRERLGRPKH